MECYECEKDVDYLFDDSRCNKCTRSTPEEVRGDIKENDVTRIIDSVSGDKVVSFKVSEDKESIRIRERCDDYFAIHLNKKEFGQMIEELKQLHGQMIDNG